MWNDSFGPARQHGSHLHCSRHWFLELRTNVKNNEDEKHVDVWFPIVFEAVLPFFGAMVGVVVAYQYQCVGYIDPARWAQPSAGPKVSHCDIHPPPLWGKIPHETGVLSALVTLIIFDPTPHNASQHKNYHYRHHFGIWGPLFTFATDLKWVGVRSI